MKYSVLISCGLLISISACFGMKDFEQDYNANQEELEKAIRDKGGLENLSNNLVSEVGNVRWELSSSRSEYKRELKGRQWFNRIMLGEAIGIPALALLTAAAYYVSPELGCCVGTFAGGMTSVALVCDVALIPCEMIQRCNNGNVFQRYEEAERARQQLVEKIKALERKES